MTRSRRPGLNEMRNVISAEADRIYAIERASRKAGEKPNADHVRRIEVLDATGDLIARLIPVHPEIAAAVKKVTIAPMQRDWSPRR